MRLSFHSTAFYRCFATSLVVSATLLVTACVHRKIGQVLPPVTLSDTRTKRNLVVGQLFFERKNGELLAGPNLQNIGLASHSEVLGPLSVSRPDITLGEFLSAIGASSASCEASLLPQKSASEDDGWFQAERDKVVGTEVSLLLEDVRNEVFEPRSLARLIKEERHTSTGDVPWLPTDGSAPHDVRGAVAVVQAI
jgi:hypothetical protein